MVEGPRAPGGATPGSDATPPGVPAPPAPPTGAALVAWRAQEWIRSSVARYVRVHGPRQSAAIAYYVLLSLFPLALVFAAGAGLVLKDESLRADFVSALTDALPLNEAGAGDLDSALRGVSSSAAPVGLISLAALVWSASGMMGAIRGTLDDLAGETAPRPFVRGKLVDFAMLLGTLILLAAVAGVTVATRVAGESVGDSLGLDGPLFEFLRILVPVVLGAALLLLILRYVPTRGPSISDVWPAAVGGAVALWGLSVGFAAFIGYFGRYNVIYGSIAAVVVFLIFVYLAANIVLVAAAFGVEWRRVRHALPGPEPGPGTWAEILGFLKGLVWRQKPPEDPA